MSHDTYADEIIGLIRGAGVLDAEIEAKETRMKIGHMFMKGIDWNTALRAICDLHDIAIEGVRAREG